MPGRPEGQGRPAAPWPQGQHKPRAFRAVGAALRGLPAPWAWLLKASINAPAPSRCACAYVIIHKHKPDQ